MVAVVAVGPREVHRCGHREGRVDHAPGDIHGEVVRADRIPLDEVEGWIAGHELCPDSLALAASALGALTGPPPGGQG